MSILAKTMSKFRLAVVQLHVTKVKADNLSRARGLIKEAAAQGAKVVVLPVSTPALYSCDGPRHEPGSSLDVFLLGSFSWPLCSLFCFCCSLWSRRGLL
uniref:CN hydrolase domain-containing protein n=1 Tax=Hucho hucho TaxID=62062 RepID=A0A4W5KXG1_9TELE